MAKLKAALANQQYSAAKAAAKKRSLQAEESKKQSIKASLSGSKKGLKRSKAALKNSLDIKTNPNGNKNDSNSNNNARNIENKLGESSTTTTTTTSTKSQTESESKQTQKSKQQKSIIPFTKDDSILLIGEGNFSFTLSLLYSPFNLNGSQILSTVYDFEEITYKKYPDSKEIIQELKSKGVKIEFGVDATNLEKTSKLIAPKKGKGKHKEKRRWSKVVFNFPHVGAGITDQDRNILTNQHMLLGFFKSVEPYLTDGPSEGIIPVNSKGKNTNKKKKSNPVDEDGISDVEEDVEEESPYIINDDPSSSNLDFSIPPSTSTLTTTTTTNSTSDLVIPNKQGKILITLLTCSPYSLWSLSKLATKPPILSIGFGSNKLTKQPRYLLNRSFDFDSNLYTKYQHRRTIGFKDGLSKGKNEEINRKHGKAKMYEFVRRRPNNDDQDENQDD
ncbi:uncharacterized protein L201_006844 [Kwoniella dendrophila CBS 6074]|uniref:25S rRNA (uridine-N(3))-methyltransferase BMT5-like domain-containing protein n=1 Tax=Kwoniella dendrophila CBS 6074 TaxID=1295534 RepID=A0AAX4K551_9TREE